MKLFLDTANFQEIESGTRLGVISGRNHQSVAGPPARVSADRESYKVAVQAIAELVDGPISVEVVSQDAAGMISEGREISEWIPNPWVKIPSTEAGFEAISVLARDGVKINQTLCFSTNPGFAGRSGRVHGGQPLRRAAGRHRGDRDGPGDRHR